MGKASYEVSLRIVLGRASSEAERQCILFQVATKPHMRGEPPIAWRRQLALDYGWQPIEGKLMNAPSEPA